MDPLDVPRRGPGRPVRRLHRPAPEPVLATWTVWAGPGPDRPTWTISASPHTPSSLLADLSETFATETGTRQVQPAGHEHRTRLATSPPAAPAGPAASRSR
ncbi:DUF317 domain-containing protein [Streptomyces sp. NPDC001137]|uniref:DUF317 domain-containing protein n=1 Tax=Streptomyces sp. NPDC001137 TaxID=3154378 RepID=UPI00332B3F3D